MTAALTIGLVLGACQGSTTTPAPTATPVATDTPTPAPTDTPVATATPAPTPTPTATLAPTVAPTPVPTVKPAATPTLTSKVAACTGSSNIKQTWAAQIPKFKFTLYCGVLPTGWSVVNMAWDYKAAGIQAHYSKGSMKIDVWEGNVCGLSPNPCTGNWPDDFGSQAFGPLTGDMAGDASSKAWTTVVHSAPTILYTITGAGMTESAFRSISAAMHKLS
jgi:hypothetical protein